jgi:UrcA family protein
MNAQAHLHGPSSSAVIAITCIALAAVAPLVALADPPIAPTPQTLESRVSLADLDLSTTTGVRAAHKRLRAKAEHLCRQLGDSASSTFRWTYAACVQESLADAIHQLNAPAFVAANRSGSKP